MRIKCGRFDYEILKDDVIFDNGSVVQVKNRITLNCTQLKISRGTFDKLLKDGKLEFVEHKDGMVKDGINYYRIKESNDGQS